MFVNHCHVYPANRVNEADAMSHHLKRGTLKNLLKIMSSLGIDKAVALAPFPRQVTLENPNDWLCDELEKHDNILGFMTVDPTRSDICQMMEKYAQKGIVGVKLHPPISRFIVNDPRLYDFYAKAEELRLPLLIHTGVHGWYLKNYRPILLDEIAQDHPKLPIIIEHMGGEAFFSEAIAVLLNNRNCFAGISQLVYEGAQCGRLWHISRDRLVRLIKRVGSKRVIYGTDFPYNGYETIKCEIETIQSFDISREEKDDVLGGALDSLLEAHSK